VAGAASQAEPQRTFGEEDVPFPTHEGPYEIDEDEIDGSVNAAAELTGISLIQRDLGAQIIAEYEE